MYIEVFIRPQLSMLKFRMKTRENVCSLNKLDCDWEMRELCRQGVDHSAREDDVPVVPGLVCRRSGRFQEGSLSLVEPLAVHVRDHQTTPSW